MNITRASSKFLLGIIFLFTSSSCGLKPDILSTPSPSPDAIGPLNETLNTPIATWVQMIGKDQENSSRDAIITPDGGLLIVGGVGDFNQSELVGGVMLVRTDKYGKLLWQETYGGEGYDFGSTIIEASDSGYLIAGETTSFGAVGSDGYLIKVNDSGQVLWSKTFGGELNEVFNTILPAPNGGYYLVGNIVDPNDFITDPGAAGYGGFAGRSNVIIVRLDAEGNQIWSQVIESKSNTLASDGLISEEGDIYVLATLIKFPEWGDDLVLMKFDLDGELIWLKTWAEENLGGYAMARDKDGNLVITGIRTTEELKRSDFFLLKVDPNGNQIFFKEFGSPVLFEIGRDVLSMDDGSYLILTSATSSFYADRSSSSLFSVDHDGAFLWESKIQIDFSIKGAFFQTHPDGGYVITGIVTDKNGKFQTILIRTNFDGSLH